jgi:hypothetical protein
MKTEHPSRRRTAAPLLSRTMSTVALVVGFLAPGGLWAEEGMARGGASPPVPHGPASL